MSGVFESIRAACSRVASRARQVEIHDPGLARLTERLLADPPRPAAPDPARSAFPEPAQTLAYVITLDAINFGSGWFPVLRKRPGCSGYFTVANALKERFEAHGPWDAGALKSLDRNTCARVFGQEQAGEASELMAHFARALRDLGTLLDARFQGSFEALVAAAGRRASRLVEILREMPLYRDVSRYDGEEVPFYKRAQITAADLHAAFQGKGPGDFDDLDELTIFADNLVPHVLRCEGVLHYAPELARRIDAGERLQADSPEEVEIRACALHAVERCVEALRARGQAVTAARLDEWLWNRGQLPEMKARPRHRARSVYY